MSFVVLKIYEGETLVEVKQFQNEQITLGSGDEAHLFLNDDSIFSVHAVIEKKNDVFVLTDMGSTEGSFVNTERVLEKQLTSADTIQVGPYRVHFFIGIPPTEHAPLAADVHAPKAESLQPTNSEVSEVEEQKNDSKQDVYDSKTIGETVSSINSNNESNKEERIQEDKNTKGSLNFSSPPNIEDVNNVEKENLNNSEYKVNLGELSNLLPGQGTTLEVLVAWQGRVIYSEHFSEQGKVHIGSTNDCEIKIPVFNKAIDKYKLVEITDRTKIFLNKGFRGTFYVKGQKEKSLEDLLLSSSLEQKGPYSLIDLGQNEMIRLDFLQEGISIFIRYTPETTRPLAAPLLDLTATELVGVLMAFLVSGLFGMYMLVYSPEKLEPETSKVEEPIRRAFVKFDPPPKRKKIVKVSDINQKKKMKSSKKHLENQQQH